MPDDFDLAYQAAQMRAGRAPALAPGDYQSGGTSIQVADPNSIQPAPQFIGGDTGLKTTIDQSPTGQLQTRYGGDPFEQEYARAATRSAMQNGENLIPYLQQEEQLGVPNLESPAQAAQRGDPAAQRQGLQVALDQMPPKPRDQMTAWELYHDDKFKNGSIEDAAAPDIYAKQRWAASFGQDNLKPQQAQIAAYSKAKYGQEILTPDMAAEYVKSTLQPSQVQQIDEGFKHDHILVQMIQDRDTIASDLVRQFEATHPDNKDISAVYAFVHKNLIDMGVPESGLPAFTLDRVGRVVPADTSPLGLAGSTLSRSLQQAARPWFAPDSPADLSEFNKPKIVTGSTYRPPAATTNPVDATVGQFMAGAGDIAYGGAQFLEGQAANAAQAMGKQDLADTLGGMRAKTANAQKAMDEFFPHSEGYQRGDVGARILEGGAHMLPTLIAMSAVGGAGAAGGEGLFGLEAGTASATRLASALNASGLVATTGGEAYQRIFDEAKRAGMSDAEATTKAGIGSLVDGVVNTYLLKYGAINGIKQRALKDVLANSFEGAMRQGGVAGVQDWVSQMTDFAATGKDPDLAQTLKAVASGAIAGGVLTGTQRHGGKAFWEFFSNAKGEAAQAAFADGAAANSKGGMGEAEARQVLGIDPNAPLTPDLVRDAYRQESLRSHPDQGGNEAQFIKAAEAAASLRSAIEPANSSAPIPSPEAPTPPATQETPAPAPEPGPPGGPGATEAQPPAITPPSPETLPQAQSEGLADPQTPLSSPATPAGPAPEAFGRNHVIVKGNKAELAQQLGSAGLKGSWNPDFGGFVFPKERMAEVQAAFAAPGGLSQTPAPTDSTSSVPPTATPAPVPTPAPAAKEPPAPVTEDERTQLRKDLAEEKRLRRTDDLTGAPNIIKYREDARAIFHQADASNEHVAVVETDIGGLKVMNTVYGHAGGDEMLKMAHEAMRDELRTAPQKGRPEDYAGSAAYRVGGDEFPALLRNVKDQAGVKAAMDRVNARFDKMMEAKFPDLPPEARPFIAFNGVIRTPGDARSIDDLRKAADAGVEAHKSAIKAGRKIPEGRTELLKYIQDWRSKNGIEPATLEGSKGHSGNRPSLPSGWTEVVGPTTKDEGVPAEAEVDWRNKRIVYRTRENLANQSMRNHELAHVIMEHLPEEQRDALLQAWHVASGSAAKGHDIYWAHEGSAVDAGLYLDDPQSVSPALRRIFEPIFGSADAGEAAQSAPPAGKVPPTKGGANGNSEEKGPGLETDHEAPGGKPASQEGSKEGRREDVLTQPETAPAGKEPSAPAGEASPPPAPPLSKQSQELQGEFLDTSEPAPAPDSPAAKATGKLFGGESKPQPGKLPPVQKAGPVGAPKPAASQPAAFASTPGQTIAGRKLLAAIAKDPEGKKIGPRAVVEHLVKVVESRILVGRTQTSAKHPAHYLQTYHIIRARAGGWNLNFHEVGHALSYLMRDRFGKAWDDLLGPLMPLVALPDSMASAPSPEEAFAEFIRRYVIAPATLPSAMTGPIERFLGKNDAPLLAGLRDTHRAWAAHSARDFAAQLRSYSSDAPPKPPLLEQARDLWHWAIFNAVNAEIAVDRIGDQLFRALKQVSIDTARAFEEKLQDTPGDFESAFQSLIHIPQEVNRALLGADKGAEGIRIRATGGGFADLDAKDLATLEDAGFTIPADSPGHGNWIYLNDTSFRAIQQSVGADWDAFEVYGQMRAALHRFELAGHRYPGLTEGFTPQVVKPWLAKQELANPKWEAAFKAINEYMDQLLLVPVLAGELDAESAVRIKEKWEDYWPLPRKIEDRPTKKSGGGAEPTAGIRRAFGSDLPFRSLPDAVETRVKMALDAYYQNRLILAVKRAGDAMAKLSDVPLPIRSVGRQLMLPLRLEPQKVAKLSEAETQKIIADYLNEKKARETGLKVEELPPSDKLSPGDISISGPGMNIFRAKRPRAVNIVAPFEHGKRRFYQVTDPLLFDLFSRSRSPNRAIALVSEVMTKVFAPVKEALTHNLLFAVRNVPRDAATALFMGHGRQSLLPFSYAAIGLVNRLKGDKLDALSETELLGRAFDTTTTRAHQTLYEAFVHELGRGIAVPGWTRMGVLEKAVELPGQLVSTILKPINLILWATGQKWLSKTSEGITREGAYIQAAGEGASQERSQLAYDQISGNYGARAGNPSLAAAWRMAGFLNPNLQILYGQYKRFFNRDRSVAGRHWMTLAWMAALSGAAAAANFLLTGKKERAKMKERTDNERMSTMAIAGRFRVPFEYGILGAAASYGWNAVEGMLLKEPVHGDRMARELLRRSADLPGPFDTIPPYLKTAIELNVNQSFWTGQQIEPDWMKKAFPNNPEERALPDTPKTYKVLASWMGTSPVRVRYAVQQLFSTQADDLVRSIEMATNEKIRPKEAADLPIAGHFFVREPKGFLAQSVKDVSQLDTEFDAIKKTLDDAKSMDLTPAEVHRLDGMAAQLGQLGEAHKAMLDVEKMWRAVKAQEKLDHPDQALIDRIERLMVDRAREALHKAALDRGGE